MTTEFDAGKLKELMEAATKGEWFAQALNVQQQILLPVYEQGVCVGQEPEWICREADADYVAYLANSAPAILALAEEVERLRKALEAIADAENPEHYGNARDAMHACKELARTALRPAEGEQGDAR